MTQVAIRKLVADSVSAALEAQAANMENTDNTNRNTRQGETPVGRKCSYKDFKRMPNLSISNVTGRRCLAISAGLNEQNRIFPPVHGIRKLARLPDPNLRSS
ncbi:hypothetical protein Tco_0267786 [Tanacetum coccineum]